MVSVMVSAEGIPFNYTKNTRFYIRYTIHSYSGFFSVLILMQPVDI